MIPSIRLDIIDLDDGYKAYYVDGVLLRESGEHAIREIIDIVNGKHVASMTYRFADKYANGEDLLPQRYEDIVW